MCFSSQASFIAGAALVGLGAVTLHLGWAQGRRYLPLAAFPLCFGLQQISEGVLWLSFDWPSGPSLAAAQVFLFFAYLVWPVLVPLASAAIEPQVARRRVFHRICAMGVALGLLLYLPVLIWPSAVQISLVEHSIHYVTPTVYPSPGMNVLGRLIYAAIICLPLVLSSHPALRGFGWLVLASVVLGFAFASHAFTSIWCFLAAVLSAYILVVLRALTSRRRMPMGLVK